MLPTHSPWIAQLTRTRPSSSLAEHAKADIVIVGGGIAGIMTAYFLLRDTNHSVVLLEADKIAHGATGHNAGQITSYFERSLADMVQEFGLDMASRAQEAVESAWGLLQEIHREAKLTTSVYTFTGHAGCCTLEQILIHLENNYCREKSRRLDLENILIAEDAPYRKKIPAKYVHLYATVPHQDILSLLETENTAYTSLVSYQKGCTNSAVLTEEIAGYLLRTYEKRFSIYEGSPVATVALQKDGAIVHALDHTVTANRVVLCTNGFTNFSITNEGGRDVDARFHHAIHGTIGYMAGYIEPMSRDPIALSYFPEPALGENGPYFYLTRRPHSTEEKKQHNLVCIGGPEKTLTDMAVYSREDEYEEDVRDSIDAFLRKNYQHMPKEKTDYAFLWHGLMGYTKTGVRLVGAEPINPVLLYNLGCNGVGILPSTYGGKRISEVVQGKDLAPSLFDPKMQGV